MKYVIRYSCCSHVGKCRSINQDNFICGRERFISNGEKIIVPPIKGVIDSKSPSIVGVFDGLGGEEKGEEASLIAARCASEISIGKKPLDDLIKYCMNANEKICEYAKENGIWSMGTTAAILLFHKREIDLCNIGDTKIFRFADEKLEQLSQDHYIEGGFWKKNSLSQCLGVPPSVMLIEPYIAKGYYNVGDVYLLCSDGLTDMLSTEEIRMILNENDFDACSDRLLDEALERGGKDNITVIMCKIESKKPFLLRKFMELLKR